MARKRNARTAPEGRIFDVSRAAVDDGPGLRTVVYLKGCPLECGWCHNPEGKRFAREITFQGARCIGCGKCVGACPHGLIGEIGVVNPPRCRACGACAEACLARARGVVGRDVTVPDLLAEVLVDRDFLAGSGGGVTFSGGEPTAQPGFLLAAARALKAEGLHVAVETCGEAGSQVFDRLRGTVDLFLFDLKLLSESEHKRLTGRGNARILANLARLLESRAEVQVRVPLVPGVNTAPGEIERIASWLAAAPRRPPVALLPFHRMGKVKCDQLGRHYPFAECAPPSRDVLSGARRLLERRGLEVTA